jgi:hypothetical protein
MMDTDLILKNSLLKPYQGTGLGKEAFDLPF